MLCRYFADRTDTRPPPPELDIKSQPNAMNELQKEREIKVRETKLGKTAKPDVLGETPQLSKAEQREVNWGILKTLVKYIWPKVKPYEQEWA